MSQIKKLVGQTAYYGISSILGRVLNFLLLPIWTDRLLREEYGNVSYLYSLVGISLIVYTYGMETAFFRFSRKIDPKAAYNNAATSVILTSVILSSLIFIGASGISNILGEGIKPEYVKYMAAILLIDAVIAIPFAKLRLEEKALKFAIIKISVIVITISLNLLLIIVFPDIVAGRYLNSLQGFVSGFYTENVSVAYIFIANLIANILYLPLLWREFTSIKLVLNKEVLKPMFAYGMPIFLMGLGGIFNEQGYNIIMKATIGSDALGAFASAVKLSVFMMLGIQAFRYAAEPFFFNHAENKEAPALFARIMHYFVVFNIFIFVAVAMNKMLLGDLFLRQESYKEALYVLPILLLAKLFYGVYVNLSVWFKIKDKTIYGTYFALAGAGITLVGNLILIPIIGFYGSAITSLLCYMTMSIWCYYRGRQDFMVPYEFKKLFRYLLLGLAVVYTFEFIEFDNKSISYALDLFVTAIFAVFMYLKEGKSLKYKTIEKQ